MYANYHVVTLCVALCAALCVTQLYAYSLRCYAVWRCRKGLSYMLIKWPLTYERITLKYDYPDILVTM